MKHNTRKLVSFLASRHWVKQVTSWSACLAAADAAWPVPQLKAPHWHGHTAAFPGAGEITPVWTSFRDTLRTFFLILLSIFITGYCPCALPLLILSPVPFCFTNGISRQVRVRPAGCRRPVLTAMMFSSNQLYLLGVSFDLDFSLHGSQGACCYTCKFISSCRRMRNTSQRKTKAVIHRCACNWT